jgi:hypothetical protein
MDERVGARARWTKLLGGAVAHDINNLVHSLSSARALSGGGSADVDTADFVEGCLAQMRTLGARLRALGSADEADMWARLDDACADARVEVELPRGQVLRAEPIPAELRVRGTAAAVRTAIASLLEHAAAATPTGGTIRLAVLPAHVPPGDGAGPTAVSGGGSVTVEIAAPDASGLGDIGRARLDALLDTSLRDSRGDLSLILAGALAEALGGAVYVASSAETGLVLGLQLVTRRAE